MSTDPRTAVPVDRDPDIDNGDESYNSEEDEDFQLDGAGQEDSDISLSEAEEDEATVRPAKRRKVDAGKATKTGGIELDSGDEAMIRKAKEKRKKKKGKKGRAGDEEEDVDFDDEEEGGEGGFVKTRSMRMRIQEERKPLAKIDGATIDVDELWTRMNQSATDAGLSPAQTGEEQDRSPAQEESKETSTPDGDVQVAQQKPPTLPSEEMIKIKRTYKFAGEMITEEKLVPKDSAEAKLFLGNQAKGGVETVVNEVEAKRAAIRLRRPLRKISRFDPNPTGFIKKSWEKQPPVDPSSMGNNADGKGPKLNTVEKSKLDWAAYVDQAGIKDDLNLHSRAKEGYLGRMDFLDRVDAKREEERRNARLKGL